MATLPAPFRARRAPMLLNIGAVGLALAAATAALFGSAHQMGLVLAVGAPTLLVGSLWAWLLRWPHTVLKSKMRLGWLLSVPMAMLNSSLVGALLLGTESHDVAGYFFGLFAGATLGAICWIPALLLTLLFFGVPIARAQRLAKKGLAGEDRGEWIVGFTTVTIGLAALLLGLARGGPWPVAALGISGALAGGTAAALALARGRRRRRFVDDVEAGTVTGYRVEPTAEGKVLLRVAEHRGYRVADFEEELYELDAEGEATQPALRAGATPPE